MAKHRNAGKAGKPMTPKAAARIQGAEARAHGGKVSGGGHAARAQAAAAKNAGGQKK